jgi:hypothetical protein
VCVAVASMHNAPFNGAADVAERRARMQALAAALTRLRLPALVLGDFNMRKAEDAGAVALGFADAFLDAGSPRAVQFTWDSHVNRYHHDGFAFTVGVVCCVGVLRWLGRPTDH